MPHKAPGRGLRRPPRKRPDPEAVARFVEGSGSTDQANKVVSLVADVSNVQDVSDVQNVQDVQKPESGPSLRQASDVQDVSDVRDVSVAQNVSNAQNVLNVSDVQDASDAQNVQASVIDRADGRKLRRTTVYFEPEVYELLRKTARLSDTDLSKLTNAILKEHLPDELQKALGQLVK